MMTEALIWTIGLLAFHYVFLPAVWRSVVYPQYLAVKWGQASHTWPSVHGEITFAPQLAVLETGVSGVRIRFGYFIITLASGLVLITLAALLVCLAYLFKI